MKRGKFILNKNRSAQSDIIAVVLLILLVVALTVIVIGFVLPFVKEKLSAGDCFDVIGDDKLGISPGYTCYDDDADEMRVQIHVGPIIDLIKGYSIEVGGASTDNYMIENETLVSGVYMYGRASGTAVELPSKENTERTYIIESTGEKPGIIKVYPVLKNGRVCDASDAELNIDICI